MKRAVCFCYQRNDGKFLAVSRKNDYTKFGFVGGKAEDNETLEEAIIREAKEETGLTVSNLKIIYKAIDRNKYITTTFTGNISGEIFTLEAGKVKWVDKEVLLNGNSCLYKEYNKEVLKRYLGK